MAAAPTLKLPPAPKVTGPGRRTKYTPQLGAALISEIQQGVSRNPAAAEVGIGVRTLAQWMAWGREGVEPFAAFTAALLDAEKTCWNQLERVVRKRATEDAEFALKVLARRRPKKWAATRRVELTGKDGQPIEMRTVEPDDVLKKLSAIAADLNGKGHEDEGTDAPVIHAPSSEAGPPALDG